MGYWQEDLNSAIPPTFTSDVVEQHGKIYIPCFSSSDIMKLIKFQDSKISVIPFY